MELRPLLQELVDEVAHTRSDASGVDPIVVMQVFDWQNRDEVIHPAEWIVVQGYGANLRTTRECVLDRVTSDLQDQILAATAISLKDVTEIGTALSALDGVGLKPLEL